jgi:hypothetical protein
MAVEIWAVTNRVIVSQAEAAQSPYFYNSMNADDFESLLNGRSTIRSGDFRLWVAVLLDAVLTLKGERIGSRELAESFIFDAGNVFLELICGVMKIEPSQFRKHLEREILAAQRIAIWQSQARQTIQTHTSSLP